MSRLQVLSIVIATATAAGGCASTGATPHPFPTPAASAPPSAGAAGTTGTGTPSSSRPATGAGNAPGGVPGGGAAVGYGITGTALSLRGAPYRDGGADPPGFDCSGFVRYVFAQNGVGVPRTVGEQWRAGREVPPGTPLAPGDLVFFSTVNPGASHVGIAIGGDEFVHAPSHTGQVRVERFSAPYWATRFVGARRVL